MIKDPTRIAEYKITNLDAKYQLIRHLMYYADQKTIPILEVERLIEMVNSPDDENMELVKVLLQQKYKIL
jgi:hypothetical protein